MRKGRREGRKEAGVGIPVVDNHRSGCKLYAYSCEASHLFSLELSNLAHVRSWSPSPSSGKDMEG